MEIMTPNFDEMSVITKEIIPTNSQTNKIITVLSLTYRLALNQTISLLFRFLKQQQLKVHQNLNESCIRSCQKALM